MRKLETMYRNLLVKRVHKGGNVVIDLLGDLTKDGEKWCMIGMVEMRDGFGT